MLAVRRHNPGRYADNHRKYQQHFLEIAGNLVLWPRALCHHVFEKSHLHNQERFMVIVFLMTNHIDPQYIIECMELKFQFNDSAWRQIFLVIKKFPTSTWTAFHTGYQMSVCWATDF